MSNDTEEGESTSIALRNLAHFSHSSLGVRLSFVNQVVTFLGSNEFAATKPGPLKRLHRALAASFLDDQYDEKSWTNAMIDVYKQSFEVALPFDLGEFVDGFVQENLTSVPHKFALPLARARLVEFCSSFISLHPTSEVQPPWLINLLSVIGEQCDKLTDQEQDTVTAPAPSLRRALHKTRHYVGDMLRKQPALLGVCLAAWFPAAQPTKARGSVCGTVLSFTKQRQPDQYEHVKQLMVDVYQKRLQVLTKQHSLSLASGAWAPFIESLTAADWIGKHQAKAEGEAQAEADAAAEGFEAILVKAMKKAPESGSFVACTLVSHINPAIDMSSFVSQVGAVSVIKMLKSSDAAVRAAGLGLVTSLAKKCGDLAAFQLLVAQLGEGFVGKGAVGAGGLMTSQGVQKRCVLYALAQCGQHATKALGSGAAAVLSVGVLGTLQTILEKEVDSSIRLQAAHCLGFWLQLALCNLSSTDVPTEVRDKTHAVLTACKVQIEKAGPNNHLCTAYLLALTVAVNAAPTEMSQLEPFLFAGCLAIVNNASKKPTAGASSAPSMDAVMALHLLVRIVRTSATALAAFEAAKLWTSVCSSTSFLFSPSLVQTLTSLTSSGNSTGGGGSNVNSFVTVTAASVAESTADSLGSAALCAETIKALVSTIDLVASERASQLSTLFLAVEKAANSDEVNQAAKALCSLMVLPADQSVRAAVCKLVNHLVSALLNEQTNGAPSVTLLKGLWIHLTSLGAQQQNYDQERVTSFKFAEEGASPAVSTGAAGSTKAPVVPSSARWAEALLACIPAGESVSNAEDAKTAVKTSGLVPHLVMVAAHPLVSISYKKAAQVWQSVCSRLLALFGLSATIPEDEDLEAMIACTAQASIGAIEENRLHLVIMIAVLVEGAVLSDVASTRKAAQHAVYLLSDPNQYLSMNKRSIDSILPELSSSVLQEHVLPALLPLLSVEQVNALSEQDLLAYKDPLAAVRAIIAQLQVESDAARAAEAVVTNADRKKTAPRSARRGNFGADSAVVEDEDWAERVRAEKDHKLMQARSEGGAEYEEIKARVLKQRAEVAKKIDRVLRVLDLWASFTAADVPTARQSLVLLLDRSLLAPLLNAPVIGAAAYQYLVCIVNHVVEPECQPFTRDICDSLRIAEAIIPSDTAPIGEAALEAYRQLYQQSGPVLRLLQCLLMVLSRAAAEHRGGGAAGRYPVLPSTFLLLYPILRGILLLPHTMPGTEHTFHLLDSLWPSAEVFTAKPGTPLFVAGLSSIRAIQKSVLDVTLRVLSRPQRMDPSADKVFLRVATQLPNTPSHPTLLPAEWEPLMGETGLLSPEMKVRLTVMQAVTVLFRERRVNVLKISPALETLLWVQKVDDSDVVSTVATELWAGREMQLTPEYYSHLKPLLSHASLHVRAAAARALAGALSVTSSTASVKEVVQSLKDLFLASLPPKPEVSNRGASASAAPIATGKKAGKGSSALDILSQPGAAMKKRDPADDKQSPLRVAIANVFGAIGTQVSLPADVAVESGVVTSLLDFILNTCMVDTHADVRNASLTAGRTLIDGFGKDLCSPLMVLLEAVIAAKYSGDSKDEDALTAFDNRNAAAVVLLGATGRHLQKDDPAVGSITKNLIAALKTPSESVQKAVADCLTPLVQVLKGQEIAVTLLESLVDTVLNGATYGERKGAAFGLSAFVKGLGIPCLKQHDIIPRLKEACANGAVNSRQGALFAFECLSERIGVLFEPYIISIVEVLLKSFSHSSDHVREAAQDAARVIMNKLSAHGVKQVLTPILSSLPNEAAWKSRQESIRLLGMMAHCAPKQLASCLPQVVPALMLAGSDPHPKVKESARAALQDISSVIRNPEVLRLSPVLLGAIGDPANKTREALEALLECEFMHSIDAPSLALLVPILARALRDRGADLKRKSAAITGNMVSMVGDAKILSPYLVQVLPGLQDCLLDPIPDVRATSAKAIGSLFVGMGEEHEELKRLIPWLSTTLSTESSPVERSGAAQGLAEICGSALEPERVMQVLQTVLRLRQQSTSGREGLLWFLSFLPATLNEGFAVYISITLPVILSGLSDENDGVREVALRAGQVVVYKLGISHTNELIPALSQGMFQEDWRIRHSSVQLLGELLCMVGETKAAAGPVGGEEEDGDEEFETGNSLARVSQKIRQHIGDAETNAVLASLYIVRSDVSMSVRQSALSVWKSIVSNSPRTLMEIMSVLVRQLIDKLASPSEMLRTVAGSALGEIVSKLGDKVLPAVVKPLREGLRSEVVSQRQGVCSGLNEIMAACTRKQAEDYIDVLVPALQQALCDPAIEVCSQAARAFLTLFKAVGVKAIHQIVPTLLETYGDGTGVDSQLGLQGLREIVQQRPRDLLEYLLPSLMASPVTVTSAKALGSIMEVAGPQLQHYLSTLIPALVLELSSTDAKVEQLRAAVGADGDTAQLDAEGVRYDALKEAAGAVMGAVTSEGVHHLVGELGRQMDHDSSVKRRRWGCYLAGQFFTHSKATYNEYVPVLLKFLLSRVAEADKPLLQAVTDALQALSVAVPAAEFMDHLEFMRSCITSTASAARHRVGPERLQPTATGELILPLFTIPKSLDPLYSILLHGLMNGSVTVREVAAETIGALAQFADVAVLKPLLIKTTGPLIRVVGDRFPSSVKAAILQTLCVLLDKGGASLKAFVPQLQTTFVKALNDPSREVRTRGAAALGRLMPLSVRVDPLLTELTTLCSKADSTAIKISALDALGTVLQMGGNKATAASLESTKAALVKALLEEDETIRASAAASLSRLVWFLEPSASMDVLLDLLDSGKGGSGSEHWTQQCGRLLGLGAVLQGASQQVLDSREEAFLALLSGCRDDRPAVNAAAVSAIAMMLSIPGSGKSSSGSAISAVVEARRAELRSAGQATIHCFASALGSLAQAGASSEIKTKAMVAIKQGAKFFFGAAAQHYKEFLPPLVNSLKEIDLRVKYSAERALKHLCEGTTAAEAASGVQPGQSALLSQYLQGVGAGNSTASAAERDCVSTVRDYMRRVLPTLPAESDNEGDD